MFRGSFAHTVDPKGRVSVPARFRDLILSSNDDRVVLTNFESQSTPCIDVYPYAAWLSMEERFLARPQFNPKTQAFTEYYIAGAQECQMDKQGRVVLPPLLRSHAQLGEAVMITGAGAKFQIWDPPAWQQVFQRARKQIFQDPTAFFNDLEL